MDIELLKHELTMSAIAAFIYSMIDILWSYYRIKKWKLDFWDAFIFL